MRIQAQARNRIKEGDVSSEERRKEVGMPMLKLDTFIERREGAPRVSVPVSVPEGPSRFEQICTGAANEVLGRSGGWV